MSIYLSLNETSHPYTCNGLEIEVLVDSKWVEVGECGEAHPGLLKPGDTGLASGWGLDRLVMLVKKMDDIRLLRSTNPKIAGQMTNLEPYHQVSNQPSIYRDMSIVTGLDVELEDICEQIVDTLGDDVELLESVEILSETHYHQLPPQAIQRLGIQPHQKNLLVRMTLQSLHTSISNQKANILRELVYQNIHQGLPVKGFYGVNPQTSLNKHASQRFLSFPAKLFEQVFKSLLPILTTAWHSRNQRPLPESLHALQP